MADDNATVLIEGLDHPLVGRVGDGHVALRVQQLPDHLEMCSGSEAGSYLRLID